MKISILIAVSLLCFGCQPSDTAQQQSATKEAKKIGQPLTKNPSVNIKPNQKVSSPLQLIFNSEALWFAHEGELGSVRLVDSDNNVLAEAILNVMDQNWMSKEPVTSKVTLDFNASNNTAAKLIFNNNNPSMAKGLNKSFEINILIEKEKKSDILVGDWYQLEPKRALKAFTLREDGSAKSLTMATLLYQSYKKVGKDKILFTIQSIGNGSSSTDEYLYSIESLSNDTMVLKLLNNGQKSDIREVYTKSHPL